MEKSTREKILDAAVTVMREQGLGGATTKLIARTAGYSEPALYRHFDDQQHLFMAVLSERLPALSPAADLIGAGQVVANLELLVKQLLNFYLESFPIAASMFSRPALLKAFRDGVRRRGAGPEAPVLMLQVYLQGEVERGRLPTGLDAEAMAQLLAGAALQQAFFASFEGLGEIRQIDDLVRRLVVVATSGIKIKTR